VIIITKLEAAHRQLTTAIGMYLDDGDLVSIHSLASNARELYEKHCRAKGVDRMFEYVQSANPERNTKELWDILNGPRNFLKHPSADLDLSASLELDDAMNATVLFYAAHDCAMLCEARTPPEVEAYNLWYLAAQFPKGGGGQDAARAEEIMKDIESAYPGLRAASLADQKRVGREMVKEARSLAGKGAGV
jgi:hypothetical protein